MEKLFVEKYLINKNDMEKYFNNMNVISKEDYIKYLKVNKKLM